MTFPENLKYTKDHEWILVDGDTATIGITDFAQRELGDIVFVDISTVGDTLNANDVFGSIEAVKTVSDLYLPVGGTVLEVNAALADNPELVNNEPYTGGWIVKLKINDNAELDNLLDATAYAALVG